MTSRLSNQSTPTSAVPNPTDTATPSDSTTPPNSVTPTDAATTTNKAIPSATATPAATDTTATKNQTVSQSVKTTTPTKSSARNNTVPISKDKYNQLKYGYTYEKIKSLLGDTGEIVTESGIKGSKNYTVTYLCHVKSPLGAELFLAFKDDKLINKMEVNLQ